MNIDFPLVLTWLVLISGLIWLVDALLLKRRRLAAAGLAADEAAREDALREPVIVEYARSFFPVLLLVLVLRSFLAEPFQIPSESMVPTLEVGDFILVNKYAYGVRLPVLGTKIVDVGAPQRGDIMVFIPPNDDRYFIKRVVGVPGDLVRYENNHIYINGKRLEYQFVAERQEYLPHYDQYIQVREYQETLGDRQHAIYQYPLRKGPQQWRVPADSYFMMGDNRGRSEDSRVWGFVPEENIVGKAVAIWVHKSPGWHLPTFARNRWFE